MATVISVAADSGEAAAPKGQLILPSGSSKGKSTHSAGVVCTPLHKKAFSPAAMTCSRRKALGKKAINASVAVSHSGGKALGKKVYTVPEGTCHPLRRALGKVNTTTGVMSKIPERKQENQPERKQENQPERKQENQPHTAVQTNEKTELDSWTSHSDEDLAECKEDLAESEEDWPEVEDMFHFDPQDFDNFDVPEECKLSNLDLRGVPLMVFSRTYNRGVEEEPTPLLTPDMSFTSSLLQANADFIASLEKLHFPELPPFPADFYEEQECCNGF